MNLAIATEQGKKITDNNTKEDQSQIQTSV